MNKYAVNQVIEFESFRGKDTWKRGRIKTVINQKGDISYLVIGDDGQQTFRLENQIREV